MSTLINRLGLAAVGLLFGALAYFDLTDAHYVTGSLAALACGCAVAIAFLIDGRGR